MQLQSSCNFDSSGKDEFDFKGMPQTQHNYLSVLILVFIVFTGDDKRQTHWISLDEENKFGIKCEIIL